MIPVVVSMVITVVGLVWATINWRAAERAAKRAETAAQRVCHTAP